MSADPSLLGEAERRRSALTLGAALAAPLLSAVLTLSACSHEVPQSPPPSTQSLVGMSKERLLACAGTPAVDYQEAGLEYLTYRTKSTVGEGYLQSTPRIPVIGSLGMGGQGYEIVCQARVALKGGAVAAVTLETEPVQESETTKSLCRPILAPCLSP